MGLLIGHAVETVAGRGWAGVRNGELLKRACGEFDVFLTMDRLLHLRSLVPEVLRILSNVAAGSLHTAGA